MSARERILARLRSAAPAAALPEADVAGWYAARRSIDDPAERVARFTAAITAAHAEVHRTDRIGWRQRFASIAAAKGLRRILVGPDVEPAASLERWLPQGLQLLPYDRPIDTWRDELFDRVDGALTFARSAIADTGSLVLWPGPGEPRLMSLVPPVHIVLLDAHKIHANLYAAMVAERWADGLPTNALLVSGPSKTADIQQTLAYGAHGPRELVVLLLGDDEGQS